MPNETHNNIIEILRIAWDTLDADLIEPLLADNLHYYSWWAMVEFHTKDDYMAYIRERFLTYGNNGARPIVKIGINRNDGENAVALQFGDGIPSLIRIKEESGKITEMWIQPAE